MRRLLNAGGCAFVVGLAAAALVGSAAGSDAKQQTWHAPAAVRANAAPPGYQVVVSTGITALPDTQTTGTASCPAGTVVYGGGAEIVSGELDANLNSSYPFTHTSWAVWVNNATHRATTLIVYAICAKKTPSWSIRSVPFNDSTTGSTYGEAPCPSTTRVLGGGVYSSSISLGENVAGSWPGVSRHGLAQDWKWRVQMTSRMHGGSMFRVYAICGRTPGYRIAKGAAVTAPAMQEAFANATCPSPRVPLSGGVQAAGADAEPLNMNSTLPVLGTSWRSWENNGSSVTRTLTPYVVCAGE
jgi:hypothetical protein